MYIKYFKIKMNIKLSNYQTIKMYLQIIFVVIMVYWCEWYFPLKNIEYTIIQKPENETKWDDSIKFHTMMFILNEDINFLVI